MTDKEVTRELPPGDTREFDAHAFKGLLSNAFKSYLHSLTPLKVPTQKREIIRTQENGFNSHMIDFPLYQRLDLKVARERLLLEEIRQLLDYAWDHGRPKIALTGRDPDRRAWELRVLQRMIHEPLARVLEDDAIEEASDTGMVTAWRLLPEQIDLIAQETACRIMNGDQGYRATCPLGWVSNEAGSNYSLGEGISLRMPTPEESARYLSRQHHQIMWHDLISGFVLRNVAMLEIKGRVTTLALTKDNRLSREIVEEEVADSVDTAKWALMLASGMQRALVEGTVTYEDAIGGPLAGGGCGAFKRQGISGGTTLDLTKVDLARVAELIRKGHQARLEIEDVRQAFWYWGRSAVAALQRDALLDAIVGLEGLLVPNPGESRYRFGLHGAAVLAETAEEAARIAKELRELYDRRSRIAHGNKRKPVEGAEKALSYLSKAIIAVIDLRASRVLNASIPVARAIEEAILLRCHLRTKR